MNTYEQAIQEGLQHLLKVRELNEDSNKCLDELEKSGFKLPKGTRESFKLSDDWKVLDRYFEK